jgi:hypothetical protein
MVLKFANWFCLTPHEYSIYPTLRWACKFHLPTKLILPIDLNDSLNETKTSQKSKYCYFFKENEKDLQQKIKTNLPVYQVIETENENFNELLISPRMLQDHMPDNLIKCMKAVLEEPAPKKPPRQFDTK